MNYKNVIKYILFRKNINNDLIIQNNIKTSILNSNYITTSNLKIGSNFNKFNNSFLEKNYNWGNLIISNNIIVGYKINGYIYLSIDYGITWKEIINAGVHNWSSINITSNNLFILASVTNGFIYLINIELLNCITIYNKNKFWTSIVSYNNYIIAADYYGYIYISDNLGDKWMSKKYDDYKWSCLSISYNGIIVACVNKGYIYYSNNYGYNWEQIIFNNKEEWKLIHITKDSKYIIAINIQNEIYIACLINIIKILNEKDNIYYNYYLENITYKDFINNEWSIKIINNINWNTITSVSLINTFILAGSNIILVSNDYGISWHHYNNNINILSIICDQTTSNIIFAVDNGNLYKSNDYITREELNIENKNKWHMLKVSNDGNLIVAICNPGDIYISINNNSWEKKTDNIYNLWLDVTLSYNGEIIAAIDTNNLYISKNYGNTWSIYNLNIETSISSIAMSIDGLHIYITDISGNIFILEDLNYNFNKLQISNKILKRIVCSSDGMYIYLIEDNGYIYSSNNYGNTWFPLEDSIINKYILWSDIIISNNGKNIIIAEYQGYIYSSNNYGNTFNIINNKQYNWKYLAGTLDLSIIIAIDEYKYIYLSQDNGNSWDKFTSTLNDWRIPVIINNNTTLICPVYNDSLYTYNISSINLYNVIGFSTDDFVKYDISKNRLECSKIKFNNFDSSIIDNPFDTNPFVIRDKQGCIHVAGVYTTSDYRIKDNILNIIDNINIDEIRPVEYYNKITKKNEYGFIAHELKEYLPNLVNGNKDDENLQSVNYIQLIPIIIKELKKLKNELSIIKKIDSLKV